MIGLGLSAGGQTVVKLSNDSIQEVQTAADIITETWPQLNISQTDPGPPVGPLIILYCETSPSAL